MLESNVEITTELIEEYYKRITEPMGMFNDKTRKIGLDAYKHLVDYSPR